MKTEKKPVFGTGSVIDGKWVILESLGKGGMGEVYLAHQLNSHLGFSIPSTSDYANRDPCSEFGL